MTATTSIDDILKALSAEFVGVAVESVHDAEAIVERAKKGKLDGASAIRDIARIAHSLKGQGGSFGYSNLTLVAHRLEDYLLHADETKGAFWSGVLSHLDRMAKIVEGEIPPSGDTDRALAGLPIAALFDGVLERKDIEVVLVSEGATQNRLIRGELEACGFRVTVIPSSLQAFPYIAQVRPQLVVASSVLPGITGIDLIRAIKAMTATKAVACILATSAKDADTMIAALPKDVPIARKGKSFASDLATAIGRVGLV